VKQRGDYVKYWYDTGAMGYSILYGVVEQAGPKMYTVRWESGIRNRVRQDNPSVKTVRPEDIDDVSLQRLSSKNPSFRMRDMRRRRGYRRSNPLSTTELALIAGGVVAVGVVGYLIYNSTKTASAAASANPLSQPITVGQLTGTAPLPPLLQPGYQGQASGPAPVGSTNAPVTDFDTTGTS
jgi:hypothetical protein